MAWVTIGTRKINTALICFVTQEQSALFVQFTGLADAMTLVDDDAVQLWKFIKAEDPPGRRDDKFHTLNRTASGGGAALELKLDGEPAAPVAAKPAAAPASPQGSPMSQGSPPTNAPPNRSSVSMPTPRSVAPPESPAPAGRPGASPIPKPVIPPPAGSVRR